MGWDREGMGWWGPKTDPKGGECQATQHITHPQGYENIVKTSKHCKNIVVCNKSTDLMAVLIINWWIDQCRKVMYGSVQCKGAYVYVTFMYSYLP